jgi:hypothetical protein
MYHFTFENAFSPCLIVVASCCVVKGRSAGVDGHALFRLNVLRRGAGIDEALTSFHFI